MEKIILNANKRKALGRKVKAIRRKGLLPANIYGKKVKSEAIEIALSDFEKVYKKAGETGVVEIQLDGEVRPVLIHNIQYDPVKTIPLHADFYQVDLKEKVTAKVHIVLVGEAVAVSNKVGVLLTQLDEVEVEALPTDLPDKIEVKVDGLSDVGQAIKVGDIKLSDKVKILTPGERNIVEVAPLVSKEAEKLAAEEEAAKAAAAASAAEAEAAPAAATEAPEGTSAATPASGEAKKEETSKAPPAKS